MKQEMIDTHTKTSEVLSVFISGFFDFGKIGVVVFFLISGYVIPYSLYKASNKKFLISRFFRLYPAYWISILCFCLVSGIPAIKSLLINATMFQKFVGIEDLVGVYWTLQIELIFYISCLILHRFNLLNNDKFIVKLFYGLLFSGLIMATFRYKLELKLPVALLLGLAIMFLGMLWRKSTLEKSLYVNAKVFRQLIIILIIVLIPLTLLAYSKNFGNNEVWYRYLISYLTALLLFKLFSHYKSPSRFLTYLGSISYSMYLLHPIVGIDLPVKLFTQQYCNSHKFLFVALFWIFSLTASSICYYLIEKPCIRLGKRLSGLNITEKVVSTI